MMARTLYRVPCLVKDFFIKRCRCHNAAPSCEMKAVVVAFTPNKSGRFKFTCGMDMFRGLLLFGRAGGALIERKKSQGRRRGAPYPGLFYFTLSA